MDTNNEKNNNLHASSQAEYDEVTREKLITDHEYDGIRELDNDLPPWWKYLFYITILFALVFFLVYHVFKMGDHQEALYEKEMAAAAEMYKSTGPSIDATTAVVIDDEAGLADGKETYDKICSVCHGKYGEGLIGPNFTDEYFIHGGTIGDMYTIVITGVIEKGMISYKDQLSPEKIQNVLSYIISLQGTDPANQKAPEGDRWVDGEKVVE